MKKNDLEKKFKNTIEVIEVGTSPKKKFAEKDFEREAKKVKETFKDETKT